ncbi:hypothetical protein N7448_003686 [Penicillium atrosanguineum]|uniref:stress responsive A/B barrel domain protein n=1 Tax=Penicillium atrosanguineum TaxID=1132637 RepID=UPI00239475B1|nr:stress responsive A/B barrel domain protein [Penicillium atrosanguineum]KAJ5122554.1 hypothetical protein N7526_009491 [Penicillium atrosanguineum]KAJ5140278.1 hypothetical protein N7448_003686 [Penicillium atrosanguineum]KAJ5310195.1 stress responsive A/B barrel domain protein [Penicillium atrosanguineum]
MDALLLSQSLVDKLEASYEMIKSLVPTLKTLTSLSNIGNKYWVILASTVSEPIEPTYFPKLDQEQSRLCPSMLTTEGAWKSTLNDAKAVPNNITNSIMKLYAF